MANHHIIELGRFGDIINLLPALHEEARRGRKSKLVVAEQFQSILDGVSYVDRVVFPGSYEDIHGAVAFAQKFSHRISIAQVWGKNHQHRRTTESYARDSWDRIGYGHLWNSFSLVFDRRDEAREKALAKKIDWRKKVVLFSGAGTSSPFKGVDEYKKKLSDLLGSEFEVVDLAFLQAERLYDVLGLFDRAQALVTIDTAFMHLAAASSVPVVALVNDAQWLATLPKANTIAYQKYSVASPECGAAAILSTLPTARRVTHVWSNYEMKGDDLKRHQIAAGSWGDEYDSPSVEWVSRPVDHVREKMRCAKKTLGDPKELPFVRDLIEKGFQESNGHDDIVVLSNCDVGFSVGVGEKLRSLVAAKGAVYSYRFEHSGITRPLTHIETTMGGWYGGLDLFAFSRQWWGTAGKWFPDMVLGRTHWDLVMRDLIAWTGGGELYASHWHEYHKSFWTTGAAKPGNEHNIKMANAFNAGKDRTRPFHQHIH